MQYGIHCASIEEMFYCVSIVKYVYIIQHTCMHMRRIRWKWNLKLLEHRAHSTIDRGARQS